MLGRVGWFRLGGVYVGFVDCVVLGGVCIVLYCVVLGCVGWGYVAFVLCRVVLSCVGLVSARGPKTPKWPE